MPSGDAFSADVSGLTNGQGSLLLLELKLLVGVPGRLQGCY
jgi:hypothetical protein